MFLIRSLSSQPPIGVLLGGSGLPRPQALQSRPLAVLLKRDLEAGGPPNPLKCEDLPDPVGCCTQPC